MERRTPIRATGLMIGIILLILTAIIPAQAFTADSLSIEVMQNGDARITFNYTLEFLEQVAVFMKIADPNEELRKAIESSSKLKVISESVTKDSAKLVVSSFASRTEKDGKTRMETPAISFAKAEEVLQKYWFAPLIHPDFSPEITTIIYPDTYTEIFTNQMEIPKTSHIV